MASLAAHDALIPRSPDSTASGIALSVMAHAALLAALAYGVSWRSPTPETISAELWAAVPQSAAPPAPEPPPPPAPAPTPKTEPVTKVAPPPPVPDPQIAIEKARKEKIEKARIEREELARKDKLAREKLERDKAERDKAERERQRQAMEKEAAAQREKAAAQAAEDARQAKIREDNLRRMMGQLGSSASAAQGTRGTAAVTAAPSASYGGRLIGVIKPNIVFTEALAGNPAAVVEVRATASGTIVGRTLVKPSGVKEWDEAVLRAIDRTAKLPPDTDGRVPTTLTITFRPRD